MPIRTVIHQFAEVAKFFPERHALYADGRHYTYRELSALAQGIRNGLVESGFADQRRIGVLTGDDAATYASILAILANGSAYVPLNNKHPQDRNARIIEDAGLEVVLASGRQESAGHIEHALPVDIEVMRTRRLDSDSRASSSLDLADIHTDSLAYLFFTSGSTGRPKGVPIYHRNLNSFMDVVLDPEIGDYRKEDRFLQMFELTFDLSVVSLFAPLCIGACCYVLPEKGIAWMNIVTLLQEHELTVALMVPSALAYLERFFDEIELPALRHSQFCGEALPQGLVEGWSKCVPNARIQNVYGPTEATIYCLVYDWEAESARAEAVNGIVAIGRPMPDVSAYVVDEGNVPVAQGEMGELCLQGPQVTDHYWRDPEKTAAAFVDIEGVTGGKAYRTGDICFVNAANKFIYCGRADFQVKIDGHRVELGEIEHHAREFAGRAQAAVIAVPNKEGTSGLHLFIEDYEDVGDALAEYLQRKLPAYMQPRVIQSIDHMPLNLNGKIDRQALAEIAQR
ncbi:MAG: amino acid adenylation domain-containing protein [Gammaproteobacteria bacterium]|nr:amino acid adenylation domain-containing protein [Gammaproteobacteria bacterium]